MVASPIKKENKKSIVISGKQNGKIYGVFTNCLIKNPLSRNIFTEILSPEIDLEIAFAVK